MTEYEVDIEREVSGILRDLLYKEFGPGGIDKTIKLLFEDNEIELKEMRISFEEEPKYYFLIPEPYTLLILLKDGFHILKYYTFEALIIELDYLLKKANLKLKEVKNINDCVPDMPVTTKMLNVASSITF